MVGIHSSVFAGVSVKGSKVFSKEYGAKSDTGHFTKSPIFFILGTRGFLEITRTNPIVKKEV